MEWFSGNAFLHGLVSKHVRVGLVVAAGNYPYTVVGILDDVASGFLMITQTGQDNQTMVFAQAIAFVHEQAEQSVDYAPSLFE